MAKRRTNGDAVAKNEIRSQIKRTAEGKWGTALGWRRFEAETGIKYHDWYGQYSTRWSDTDREAGLQPNRTTQASADAATADVEVIILETKPVA